MNLAIVGSRNYHDYEEFEKHVNDYLLSLNVSVDNIAKVISGGSSGVDFLAETWARKNGLNILIFKALWGKYGKAAGPIRNSLIVNYATHMIAFPSNLGSGTQDSINKAKTKGINVKVIFID